MDEALTGDLSRQTPDRASPVRVGTRLPTLPRGALPLGLGERVGQLRRTRPFLLETRDASLPRRRGHEGGDSVSIKTVSVEPARAASSVEERSLHRLSAMDQMLRRLQRALRTTSLPNEPAAGVLAAASCAACTIYRSTCGCSTRSGGIIERPCDIPGMRRSALEDEASPRAIRKSRAPRRSDERRKIEQTACAARTPGPCEIDYETSKSRALLRAGERTDARRRTRT